MSNPFAVEKPLVMGARLGQFSAAGSEQIELIKRRCVLVGREHYASLHRGNRIYYVRGDDGKFSMGGVVQRIFLTKEKKELMLELETDSKYEKKKFVIHAKNISELYCETDVAILQQLSALKQIQKNNKEDEDESETVEGSSGTGSSKNDNPFAMGPAAKLDFIID